jgi:excinuclease ABC subunit A
VRGYSARRFSFNQAGGRCEACEGAGQKRIEMHFLPDVWITCDACDGARFTAETLAVKFHGKTIADVLAMSVTEALELFASVPRIRKILQTLYDVGLGYIPLGQSAPTLSGGEAQRVKLAAELARPDTGRTLYILDEPTTGLHFDDVRKLLDVIHRLADLGNTVIVIEHNLEVIKTADWVIDLGPDAGLEGGDIVVEGTPEEIVKNKRSQTGKFLKPVLKAGPHAERPRFSLEGASTSRKQPIGNRKAGGKRSAREDRKDTRLPTRESLVEAGISETKAPWELDGRQWHTRDRIARNGQPTRWDGQILARIVDQVEETARTLAEADEDGDLSSGFAPTDWSQRNFVKVSGANKSQIAFPFFHATTSAEWVVTLRFFVPRNAFRPRALESQLALVAFHESETPVLCDQPRLKVTDIGPFDEITIVGHAFDDFDTPGFDAFLRKAVEAFLSIGKPAKIKKASELA